MFSPGFTLFVSESLAYISARSFMFDKSWWTSGTHPWRYFELGWHWCSLVNKLPSSRGVSHICNDTVYSEKPPCSEPASSWGVIMLCECSYFHPFSFRNVPSIVSPKSLAVILNTISWALIYSSGKNDRISSNWSILCCHTDNNHLMLSTSFTCSDFIMCSDSSSSLIRQNWSSNICFYQSGLLLMF